MDAKPIPIPKNKYLSTMQYLNFKFFRNIGIKARAIKTIIEYTSYGIYRFSGFKRATPITTAITAIESAIYTGLRLFCLNLII